jgi:Na+/melibiose symporter-like transporter
LEGDVSDAERKITPLRKRAQELISECQWAASAFGRRAQQRDRLKNITDALSLLFGLIAIISYTPFVKARLGETAADATGFTAAILLVASIIVDRFFSRDPPERLKDYAFYMDYYAAQMRSLLDDEEQPNSKAKLQALVELGSTNVTDACAKWPDIRDELTRRRTSEAVSEKI